MKPSRKRRKKGELTKLKAILWGLCRSIQIKKYGNTCYSCGATGLVGSNLHCGHFIPSSVCSVALRFSLENLRPQCMVCNVHRSGNWPAYEEHLKLDGIDIQGLKRRNEATKGKVYKKEWFQEKIKTYQQILNES